MPLVFRTTGTLLRPGIVASWARPLRWIERPVLCAVLTHGDEITLIDTGWSREQCAFPDLDPGFFTRLSRGMRVRPEDALASQLLSIGLDPAHVRHIVPTPLSEAHLAALDDFPNAVVHTSDVAWTAHRTRRDRSIEIPSARVEAHALHGPPALGFTASHDVFGDGSVRLLGLPGRPRTAIAVAVQLERGPVVHAGAAFAHRALYADPRRTPWHPDAQALATALRIAEREHGARIVLSHDPDGFAHLPNAPDSGWKGSWESMPKPQARERRPKQHDLAAG